MPAVSKAMQMAVAIALHHPEKLYKRNRGLTEMTQDQLREFASTPRQGLPRRARDLAKALSGAEKS